jgi:hypothetical protein
VRCRSFWFVQNLTATRLGLLLVVNLKSNLPITIVPYEES